jgi:hypothetical protein
LPLFGVVWRLAVRSLVEHPDGHTAGKYDFAGRVGDCEAGVLDGALDQPDNRRAESEDPVLLRTSTIGSGSSSTAGWTLRTLSATS